MKFWDIFLKIVEIITPSFLRSLYKNRFDRLKAFFDERKKILETGEDEATQTVLLNAAASALTGAKNAKIEELDFFLENFEPSSFENDYWAFARNRMTYLVIRDESSKIIAIQSIKSERYKMYGLNIFLIFSMVLMPSMLYYKSLEVRQAYHIITGLPVHVFTLIYWGICFICALTIIKILYDWTCWQDFNNLIKKKFP